MQNTNQQKWLEQHSIHTLFGKHLELFEDLIVLSMIMVLFALSFLAIHDIGVEIVLHRKNFQEMIHEFIYVFILAELFRLTIIYLKERRIDIDTIVNTTIISILRDVIIKTSQLSMSDFIGISLFLLTIAIVFKSKLLFLKEGKS
jgi:uncharacterized membrane protein (DUF373 family)